LEYKGSNLEISSLSLCLVEHFSRDESAASNTSQSSWIFVFWVRKLSPSVQNGPL